MNVKNFFKRTKECHINKLETSNTRKYVYKQEVTNKKIYRFISFGVISTLITLSILRTCFPQDIISINQVSQYTLQNLRTKLEYTKDENKDVDSYISVNKKIALTFDDGPTNVNGGTMYLLEGLKERNIIVSFFLMGKQVEAYPELVREIYELGHLIGNHTYSHVNLMELTDTQIIEELEKTNELIEAITGEKVAYMRPPFGAWDNNREHLTGMMNVMWDIDPKDWNTNNTSLIVQKVVTNVKENDIILLHDGYKSSADAAFLIIDILQEKGYEFVTVDKLLIL